MDRVALEDLDQGLLELGRTGPIEQREQSRRGAPEIVTALGDQAQEALARGRGLGQSVESSVLACSAFFLREAGQVLRQLDLLIAIPAAGVNGDDLSHR